MASSTDTRLVTADELLAMPDDGMRHELVEGEIRTMNKPGGRHGLVAMHIGSLVHAHVREHGLGTVFAAETGFRIASDPDTVRAPDVAFVSRSRAERVEDVDRHWPLAPDLAVEVVSPSDTASEVHEKALSWLESGTTLVLVVDPRTGGVTSYETGGRGTVMAPDDVVDLGAAVPGFAVPARDLLP